ncbi:MULTISPECIES: murein L,D-transpeptidase catalytic domain family protein [unclassified Methylophaga]|jgi:hypothetical protein|uniref:murein L,D-transpeptidase catalytic domain family protein n=1 Tax=unclassified Methylophaga TaxID=2629249 RepID=UPI000C8BA4A6|nr:MULTISPECIES: murein L,D-transpeptidase catalytic domain family protein [unclassified Methylophaga]MAK67660.1 hypothetical protein [Methylophaga sp.]MAY18894.1 hypothetical protein [Methylophaga sp.]HCD03748.1 hypothetical protein [Methylophaga sp.]|tara:strand:+ start:44032 stop:44790 length:759 start_codon:yes stop_codon:yes gene_type:complete
MHQFTSRRLTAAFVLSFLLVLSIPSHSNDNAINAIGFKSVQPSLNEDLVRQAPNLNRAVLDKAIAAMTCAVNHGIDQASRLAIIDFSLPSSEPRLWIFDLDSRSLILEELVAHGRNSGDNVASKFSNVEGSHKSSIGLFRASESYIGRHGYSLRMDGLEPGINDRARERAIVIHGADYVNNQWIKQHGRIGRSHGCPAVSRDVADQVVDILKDGQFVFSYYPDDKWLASSPYLNCQPERVATIVAPLKNSGS